MTASQWYVQQNRKGGAADDVHVHNKYTFELLSASSCHCLESDNDSSASRSEKKQAKQ